MSRPWALTANHRHELLQPTHCGEHLEDMPLPLLQTPKTLLAVQLAQLTHALYLRLGLCLAVRYAALHSCQQTSEVSSCCPSPDIPRW